MDSSSVYDDEEGGKELRSEETLVSAVNLANQLLKYLNNHPSKEFD